MKKTMHRRKKEHVINKTNAFKGSVDPENFRFTNHFFQRWNERMTSQPFEKKEDLEEYIRLLYQNNKIEYINGDYYIIDEILFTATADRDNGIVFITVYGMTHENQVMLNILLTKGAKGINKANRKYGKINLTPS